LDIGLIAMKALCGGLLANIPAAFAFFRQYDNVLPIWGIQHEEELDEFLLLEADPPVLSAELQRDIEADRSALQSEFCRGCGYCLPCPNDIPINMAARMGFLLRRAPYQQFLTPEWQEKMRRIESCTNCGSCIRKCPYGLDTPNLLKRMLADYDKFAAEHA
jgi:predicted aldo/keto reductase-like oxidoreductase